MLSVRWVYWVFWFLILPKLVGSRDVPKILPFSFDKSVEIDQFTSVICSLKSGSRPINFKWNKNGHELESNKETEITQTSVTSTITIYQIQASSSGNYTCEAKNSYGSDSYTASLIVNGNYYTIIIING